MKKIRFLTFLGALLCSFFIFNLNYKASANNFTKINIYDVSYTFIDRGGYTSLYEVKITFNSAYELKDNATLYFNSNEKDNLRTPLNRGYNSYNVININKIENRVWELNYDIALLNTLIEKYNDDIEYILLELIDIYIEFKPADDTFKEIDLIYNQNFIVSNYRIISLLGHNYVELAFSLQSDYFINNPHLPDVYSLYSFSNLIVRLLNFENPSTYFENYSRQYYEINRDDGIIIAELRIREDYFTYYYEQIVQVSKDVFFQRFIEDYISDILNYIKYYVRYVNEDYNYGYSEGYSDGHSKGYDDGYNKGADDGYNNGYDDGLEDGYNQGFNDGYDNGYDNGYEVGIKASQGEAYDLGYKDGYNKSFVGTMDKWLVPAIILVMFIGGFFAIARKKRDGDI